MREQDENYTIEECSELIKAICKKRRHETEGAHKAIVEELIDVEIMVARMLSLYSIPDVERVRAIKHARMERQRERETL